MFEKIKKVEKLFALILLFIISMCFTIGAYAIEVPKISPADDLAVGADPSQSDNGWGGGWNKWDLTDGIRTYDGEWARGLAFWYGEWHQVTLDFGHQITFNRVIQWYHGGMNNNEAAAYKLQYWDGTNWVDIFETNNSHAYLKYPDANPNTDWWYYWSTPYENTFNPVVSDKLRIWNYPLPNSHTWLYEVEVYNDLEVLNIDIVLNQGTFTVGQTLTIAAHVTNGPATATVDAKVWLELPTDKLLSLLNISKVTIPANADISPKLFTHQFKGNEPVGEYKCGGRFLNWINGDILSEDIETFTFNKP